MTTKLLALKVILLTIIFRKSVCFMFGDKSGVPWSWSTLWKRMNTRDNHLNFKSSCPWEYVMDKNTQEYKPQLLSIHEKWCRTCCIDLNQSNATHLIINPNGQCSEIKAYMPCSGKRAVVGYTCTYAVNIPTYKRNEGVGPIVNSGLRDMHTTPKPSNEHAGSSIWDGKTSMKTPVTYTKEESAKNGGDFDKGQNDKNNAAAHQHGVPQYLSNAQFRYPQFLQNNFAQFRPGFLNGMGMQMRQQQMIPMLVQSQRKMDPKVTETPEEIIEYFDGDSNSEFLGVEDTQDKRQTEQGGNESTDDQTG